MSRRLLLPAFPGRAALPATFPRELPGRLPLAPLPAAVEGRGAALGRLLLLGRVFVEALRLAPFPPEGLGEAAAGPRGVGLPWFAALFATDEEGRGAALGRLELLGRTAFGPGRLAAFPTDGLGAGAVAPRGPVLPGRAATFDDGFGLVVADSALRAGFEEGRGAVALPRTLLWGLLLVEGRAEGRGAGAPEILGELLGLLLGRGAGRAADLFVAGLWGTRF